MGSRRALARGGSLAGGGGGCFIATAAFGTPMAREINVLRKWRDQSLMNFRSGRFFVNFYYAISPAIARYITRSEKRKAITRGFLKPIIKILDKKR